jgi:hypothetical protein
MRLTTPFLLLVSVILLLSFSCNKDLDDIVSLEPHKNEYKTYVIKQGQQYTGSITSEVKTTELKFKVMFDSSAIYTTTDPGNQIDINKLFGFSDCGVEHHKESARFGWRWTNDSLRLFAYCYKNSVLTFHEMGTVQINNEHSCRIKIVGDKYLFDLDGKLYEMERGCSDTLGKRFRLFPFFGGDENAPHDITIKIMEED